MLLVVEARDLDTDERTVAMFPVEMPIDPVGQRSQLTSAVAVLHPDARLRSFDDGAASFVASQQLVVAHYEPSEQRVLVAEALPSREQAEHLEQQSLFAA